MINPDDEIEARWKEFTEETWVNNPRTKGLKRGIFVYCELANRFSEHEFTSYEWSVYDYADIDLIEKEPPPKPVKKPIVHTRYNGKQNYAMHNQKRNFNQRRR